MRHHDQSCDRASHWTSVTCVFTRSGLFLRIVSLHWMSRASRDHGDHRVVACHLAVVPATAVVRMSPDC